MTGAGSMDSESNTAATQRAGGWPGREFGISPLPDFLEDHTLLSDEHAGRLSEHLRRWTQFVRSLWWRHDHVTYRLSYRVDATGRRVHVSIGAGADVAADQIPVDDHLRGLLKAARIPFQEEEVIVDPREEIRPGHGYEVRQRVETNVWNSSPRMSAQSFPGLPSRTLAPNLGMGDLQSPPVPFPWRGPGGTFQLPVATLLDIGGAAELSVLLRPVTLLDHERHFLRTAAADAESKGGSTHAMVGGHGQTRDADPAAHMAAELYLSQFRRLNNPFLVCVRCLADTDAAARSLAAVIEAVVLEPPLEGQDPRGPQLPSGALVTPLRRVDSRLVVPRSPHGAMSPGGQDLSRLSLLCDAAGAATVFRLPVSVQGGVPGIATRQMSPDYDPGPMPLPALDINPSSVIPRRDRVIVLGALESGAIATVPLDDLTKHALITGFTGAGKTVTVLSLLDQLWRRHGVPFLVLESAKQEYRGFFGVPGIGEDLRVYTLGNETGVPLRLNPFELLPGVRVEAHISRLQVCIEGAIPPVGPSSSVIAESLVRVYARRGWRVTERRPPIDAEGDQRVQRRFPTLSEFVDEVAAVLVGRKYSGELLANLTAALVGRLRPLLLGSKGMMFDRDRSDPPIEELFRWPTILELNDLNLDDKALVVMFLLTLLREHREQDYRRLPPEEAGLLRHVTMVEEAHNVLAEVSSHGGGEGAGADTRYKAVESFCQLLTEVRALGEGLMIADQSPEKLARDAVRNTNLQIAHQLRDAADRDAIARAMIMTPEQRDFLGKLGPGRAALFRTGLERATFVQVPPYYGDPDPGRPLPGGLAPHSHRGAGFLRVCSDEDVRARMARHRPDVADTHRLLPLAGCASCTEPCRHRDRVHAHIDSPPGRNAVNRWNACFEAGPGADTLAAAVGIARDVAAAAGGAGPAVEWCAFVHLWHEVAGRVDQPAERSPNRDLFDEHLRRLEGRSRDALT